MPAHDVLAAAHEPRDREVAAERRLVVAWQHPEERSIEPIGFLTYDGHVYRFGYIRNSKRVKDFRPLMGFHDLDAKYESADLFPLFAQRAMDPRRPDYQRYVERLGLAGESTPWEQIARSQGRREGDTIQLFPEPTTEGDTVRCRFLVHGTRHAHRDAKILDGTRIEVTREQVQEAVSDLREGDELLIVPEPENPKNPQALVVAARPLVPVGWIPDLIVEDLHQLMSRAHVTVTADRINGPDAPAHMRLLAGLRASPAPGFRFFTGERWQPLFTDDGK
jgi:hypothetical protein